jgi:hypothetical protein
VLLAAPLERRQRLSIHRTDLEVLADSDGELSSEMRLVRWRAVDCICARLLVGEGGECLPRDDWISIGRAGPERC